MTDIMLLFSIGIFAGLASGLIGIGGGLVVVPCLMIFFQHQGVSGDIITQLAFGTSMFVMIFTSISSVQKHYSNGNVLWKASITMGLASIAGGFLGGLAASYLPGNVLRYMFALLLLAASYRLLKPMKQREQDQEIYSLKILIPAGFSVGFLGAALGIGGGTFSIPFMIIVLHYPVKKVAGTSSGIIIFTAIAASIGYIVGGWSNPLLPEHTYGFVDLYSGLPIMAGSIIFARVGALINSKMSGTALRMFFGTYLFAMFVKIFFFS